MAMRLCPKCERRKKLTSFYKGASRCKECRAEDWRKYVSTERGRLRHLAAQKAYLKTEKGKQAAARAKLKKATYG